MDAIDVTTILKCFISDTCSVIYVEIYIKVISNESNVYSLYHDTDPIQQKVLEQRFVASYLLQTFVGRIGYTYVKPKMNTCIHNLTVLFFNLKRRKLIKTSVSVR